MARPDTLPGDVCDRLAAVDPDAADPCNLFRVHLYNDASRAGLAGVPDWVPRYAPFAVLGLALLLLVALGALWSANRQLADQQLLIDDLHGRLALQGETQAELNTQYRSLAFLLQCCIS